MGSSCSLGRHSRLCWFMCGHDGILLCAWICLGSWTFRRHICPGSCWDFPSFWATPSGSTWWEWQSDTFITSWKMFSPTNEAGLKCSKRQDFCEYSNVSVNQNSCSDKFILFTDNAFLMNLQNIRHWTTSLVMTDLVASISRQIQLKTHKRAPTHLQLIETNQITTTTTNKRKKFYSPSLELDDNFKVTRIVDQFFATIINF